MMLLMMPSNGHHAIEPKSADDIYIPLDRHDDARRFNVYRRGPSGCGIKKWGVGWHHAMYRLHSAFIARDGEPHAGTRQFFGNDSIPHKQVHIDQVIPQRRDIDPLPICMRVIAQHRYDLGYCCEC